MFDLCAQTMRLRGGGEAARAISSHCRLLRPSNNTLFGIRAASIFCQPDIRLVVPFFLVNDSGYEIDILSFIALMKNQISSCAKVNDRPPQVLSLRKGTTA